uniref:Uncharacterized protein n=1 Tax=Chromera velia CCMP2878 TaxID=1169474 RepID=A0A0G4EY64_9ALVE|eukprot:Cvel_14245.t1-p1 / transcript=Cvel_14245.t1 / gene=Cvel_14245 / organism=Chromera_velia_CCMP2878 / gene_product=hypothetical protein / transcript_product=hypothetical protein / location=Cvel_scaffold1005:29374-30394(-) / protein_length=237 / sequence_SO=supercontig / SO=protein_coding / is_pseudo=false
MVRLPSLPENLSGGLLGVHEPHWPSDRGWLSSCGVGGFPAPFDTLRWLCPLPGLQSTSLLGYHQISAGVRESQRSGPCWPQSWRDTHYHQRARFRYYRAPPFPSGAAACLLRPNIAPESSPPESCGGREETGGRKSRLDPGGGNGSGIAVTLDGWGGWWRGGDRETEGFAVWGTAEPVKKPRSSTNASISMPLGGPSRVCYLVGASVWAPSGGSPARERAVGSVPSSVSGPRRGCMS